MRFSNRKLKLVFLSFYVVARETEKQKKWKKAKKPIKIVF